MKYILSFSFVFIFSFAFSATGYAQDFLEQFEKELPVYTDNFLPQAEFESKTTLYNEVPFGDPELAYKIRLPKDWIKSDQTSSETYQAGKGILGTVARYDSEARLENRSRLEVQVLGLEHQVSALHWFMQYLLNEGLTLQGIKSFNYSRVEALHVEIQDKISYAVRSVAWISGNRMVFVRFFTPFDVWAQEQLMQSQIMADFELLNPALPQIEEIGKYRFLDLSEFDYPKSWQLIAPNIRSIDEMEARLVNKSKIGALDGKIDINLISAFNELNLEQSIDKIKNNLKRSGLEINELIEKAEDDYTFNKRMKFGVVDVYDAHSFDPHIIKYELWMGIMADGGYFYFVTLLTPARKDDFFVWSRNVETFKFVVENIRSSL